MDQINPGSNKIISNQENRFSLNNKSIHNQTYSSIAETQRIASLQQILERNCIQKKPGAYAPGFPFIY